MSRILEKFIATKCVPITPDNNNHLSRHGFVFVLGNGGNVKVETVSGDIVIIPLEPKEIVPLLVTKVFFTDTNATNIHILS